LKVSSYTPCWLSNVSAVLKPRWVYFSTFASPFSVPAQIKLFVMSCFRAITYFINRKSSYKNKCRN
jgi:hypothetical protein